MNIMLVITKGKGKIATSILIFKCIHPVGMWYKINSSQNISRNQKPGLQHGKNVTSRCGFTSRLSHVLKVRLRTL